MKRITHNRAISQGGKRENTEQSQHLAANLTLLHDSAYAEIAQPQKVVVVPRYFISHWLPLLGPSLAWLVLAFRQAAFVSQCPKTESIRALPVRKLSSWAGLSHGQIWNLVQNPGWLQWFVRKISPSTQRQESDTWGVQTAIPIAPHHLSAIRRRVAEALEQNPDLDAPYLAQLMLEEAHAILFGNDPSPGSEMETPETIHDMFTKAFGALDSKTTKLLDELAGRVTQPGNTIAISHYFIKRWRSELTSGEAWLVHVLRTQIYSAQHATSYLAVAGGKSQLARAIGVNTRSVRRWFARIQENPLGRFVVEPEMTEGSGHLGLQINMVDPLHPKDSFQYERLIASHQADKIRQSAGQNWTSEQKGQAQQADKIEQASGQNWTKARTYMDKDPDKSEHRTGQNWTPAGTKLDALIDLNKKPNENLTGLQQQRSANLQQQGVGEWDIDRILQSSGVAQHKRKSLQAHFQQNQQFVTTFLAWLIYGYEHRTNSGSGINSPGLFAVSRYAQNEPAPKYAMLAALTPEDLRRLIKNRFSPDVRQDLQQTLSALETNGFCDLLQSRWESQSISLTNSESNPAASVCDAPKLAPPQDAESEPSLPASAEAIWAAFRQTAQVEPEVAPVSLWLDEHILALSFLHPEQALEVEQAIGNFQTEIRKSLPGYAFQVRTLEMRQTDGHSLPVVGIKSEKTIYLE